MPTFITCNDRCESHVIMYTHRQLCEEQLNKSGLTHQEGLGEGLFFFMRGFINVSGGQSTSFWEDIWLVDTSLALQYLNLYNIIVRKEATVAAVLGLISPLNS